MLQDLRLKEGLTRAELASITHRTINYIVKAEQLTFPTPPPSLIEFYSQRLDTDREILKDAYRDAQRTTREGFLRDYKPLAHRSSFRRRWAYRLSGSEEDLIHPTEYALSKGLCIPAATVYRSEKDGTVNQSIKDALSDLVNYALSGRFQADFALSEEVYDEITILVRMKQEMGA